MLSSDVITVQWAAVCVSWVALWQCWCHTLNFQVRKLLRSIWCSFCHVKCKKNGNCNSARGDFCISQTHDAASRRNANLHYSIAPLFFFMLSSSRSHNAVKQAHESLQREEEKERQPAGGGKTKGKVKACKGRRGEESGRESTEERWERKRGQRRLNQRGRLSAGTPIDPTGFWSCIRRVSAEWQPGRTSPLFGGARRRWQRGTGALAFLVSSCVLCREYSTVFWSWSAGKKHPTVLLHQWPFSGGRKETATCVYSQFTSH